MAEEGFDQVEEVSTPPAESECDQVLESESEGDDALVEEVFEMELEEDDIYAYLVDEDDNEIGFVILDENGEEQEYYYVDMDEYELVEEEDEGAPATPAPRAASSKDDEDEFDLGITREGVAEVTSDLNAIYKEGAGVVSELKGAMDDINESMGFLRKRRK